MGQVVGEQDGAVLSVIGTRGLHGLFKSSSLSDILILLTNFFKKTDSGYEHYEADFFSPPIFKNCGWFAMLC